MKRFFSIVVTAWWLLAMGSAVQAQLLDKPSVSTTTATAPVTNQSPEALEREKKRISTERAAHNKIYDEQRKNCYQKFAVNDCLTQLKREHLAKLNDLKRQEVAVHDVERKQHAVDTARQIEQQTAQQLKTQKERQAAPPRIVTPKIPHPQGTPRANTPALSAKSAPHAANPPSTPKPRTPPTPRGALPPPRTPLNTAANRQIYDSKIKQHREQVSQRVQNLTHGGQEAQTYKTKQEAAAAHRAEIARRETERKKPLAKPLPAPGT